MLGITFSNPETISPLFCFLRIFHFSIIPLFQYFIGEEPLRGRRFKTAFILGAGLGTRLRPLTERCPKPLLEIGGRPIITYAMDHLQSVGVDRFIVNTHHCSEVYLEMFPDRQWRGVPITFRH